VIVYEDLAGPPDADLLHSKLYQGSIVRFRDLVQMQDLVAFARDFLERSLAPHAPVKSHRGYGVDAIAGVYARAQGEFGKSPEAGRLWRAVFEAAGLDPETMARDRMILRFQPPVPAGQQRPWARSTATVDFHRDTWGTNLYAQVNWWAPVYPIDPGRTFAFFPHLFARPLANTSSGFDISDVMRRNREAPETVKADDMAPRLLEQIEWEKGSPVVIAPGEVIAFSAQHAHAGVPNHTPFTRISLETRTLRIADLLSGRGARNVDGRARWMTPGMFRRVSDNTPLTDILHVEALAPFEWRHEDSHR
jgi:hypothetical protein